VKEESGYSVRAARLLALWDLDKHPPPPPPFHLSKFVFLYDLLDATYLGRARIPRGSVSFARLCCRSFHWAASPRGRPKGFSSALMIVGDQRSLSISR